MKRSGPIKRKTALARGRAPVKRIKPARAKQLAAYARQRIAFLKAHPWCQWWLAEMGLREDQVSLNGRVAYVAREGVFTGQKLLIYCPHSAQVHHKAKRRGAMLLDESQWMAVSEEGHKAIERDKAAARRKGYLKDF